MSEPMKYPGVGSGVHVRKDGKLLLGLRTGGAGAGMWCAPGGKFKMFEKWEDNARRETREEAGIEIQNVRFIAVLDDTNREAGTHFVTLHFVADWASGELVPEQGKFEKWDWFSWDELPAPLFWATRNFYENGYNPLTI